LSLVMTTLLTLPEVLSADIVPDPLM